jgi:hypothetical protein
MLCHHHHRHRSCYSLLQPPLLQLHASMACQQLQVDAACAGGAALKLTVAGVS